MTDPASARRQRPRVKICGVTTPSEAVQAALLGADFLGLNFYPPSPRYVTPARAAAIAAAVRDARPATRLVGVVVDLPAAEVAAIDRQVGLDLLQYHGAESPEAVGSFAARAIKAFRVRGRFEPAALEGYEGCWGYLFDTYHPRLAGGSGQSWDFSSLRELSTSAPRHAAAKPVFIAGGLGPDNVGQALRACRAYGVDVCSGVESAPGRKDPARMAALFRAIEKEEDHGQT